MNYEAYLPLLLEGDFKSLARCITLVENETEGYEQLLRALPGHHGAVTVGVTGAPGTGKSTLVDTLTAELLKKQKRVAIFAVDPSSPFHSGSLLGDRVRMSRHFNHPGVFIRSLASRGSLGGLAPRIIELCDLVQAAGFDYLFIETVGVGQSEVEIAGIADTTVVVVVPEGGDEIQSMKAGVMEIADIFVVNKADREGADGFAKHLHALAHRVKGGWRIPVIKTIATQGEGISGLAEEIQLHQETQSRDNERKSVLLAEKAFQLISLRRMRSVHRAGLLEKIRQELNKGDFNLYRFVSDFEKR